MLRCRLSPLVRGIVNSRACSHKSPEGGRESLNAEEEANSIKNFGEAFKKLESFREEKPRIKEEELPFATLLRKSKLVSLGDPEGKLLVGQVTTVMNNDVYIDFGGKFPAVCKRPARSAIDIRPGMFVRIRLHDLEISTRFLGAEQDVSLLEADATLLGIAHGQKKIDLKDSFHKQS